MPLPPKVCPECREEYLHTVSVCVHCEVPLVLSADLGRDPPAALPPPEELHCVRTAAAGWAVGLSEWLREEGIPHRVEPVARRSAAGGAAFGVYVLPDDARRAGEIDARYLEAQIPEVSAGAGDAPLRDDACPACGETLEAEAPECPGCGLVLAEPE